MPPVKPEKRPFPQSASGLGLPLDDIDEGLDGGRIIHLAQRIDGRFADLPVGMRFRNANEIGNSLFGGEVGEGMDGMRLHLGFFIVECDLL
jgi:hypothetical protein